MRRTASTLVAVLLLAACASTPEVGLEPSTEEPSPTAAAAASPADGDAASASPSPAPAADIDVTTTPDEVTPEWVTAVVNTLLAEYGEMTAEILAMPVQEEPTLPEGFDERLDALFDGEYLERRRQELHLYMRNDQARSDLREPADFGALTFLADTVQVASANCIVAVGRLSQATTKTEGEELPWLSAVSLSPSESRRPTPWVILDELPNTNPSGALNPDSTMLESALEDYGDALQNTCRSEP